MANYHLGVTPDTARDAAGQCDRALQSLDEYTRELNTSYTNLTNAIAGGAADTFKQRYQTWLTSMQRLRPELESVRDRLYEIANHIDVLIDEQQ
jgi:WXG100 family type VII secretion target